MAEKALYFDGSRCSACQACVAACGRHFGITDDAGVRDETARAFGRALTLDEEAPLAVARTERVLADGSVVWEPSRLGCVHCAQAPCAEVCPTGALAVSNAMGFVALDGSRCVSCHMCAMVCPADAPRHYGERGEVRLCDGCAAEVAEGGVPACAAACPLDALVFDDREAAVARANERAAALRERGWGDASVLGVSEQGGHHVVQVMKYGVAGSAHETLANTGEVEWLDAAKMAGPVSLGILGLAAAGAVVGYSVESRKQQAAEAEAAAASAGTFSPLLIEEDFEGEGEEASRDVVGESALQAALRKRNALRSKKGATPAAAAAAAIAAVPVEEYHWYTAEASKPLEDYLALDTEPRLVSCGRERFGMKEYAAADDAQAAASGDVGDTGEIPVVDELSDTGELYDVEEFNRLLAEDAALAEEAELLLEDAEENGAEEGIASAEEAALTEDVVSVEEAPAETTEEAEGSDATEA
ncbi:4Fe-4S dicluster domain-containing protein [Adlercreutzia sp. R25]|uniref:4Fe-4S dicluster domain-containing protein n=1 Tax=Adlercreutzia shanghongiae TaxID=3111773 RepID=A0ABU6IZI5_9ACTN|nr:MULTISPECIES: 4Fe-4S dicluster domain-containing protein [unclassified Adlercreutzia]MEC4272805.1 4Fe-4S dicluster domain-containing protein [Adlercreutzia sp. R25]MEC4295081.1 4Fe-4S dicluster domain-containing protein [Adlercreutzia sp. R22]